MSERNVEVVLRWLTVFENERKIADRVEELWDEHCDYYPVARTPDAAPMHDRQAIAAYLAAFVETWDTWEMSDRHAVAIDDVRVLARTRVQAARRGPPHRARRALGLDP